MTGREILEQVYQISFHKGNYISQIEPLEVEGRVDQKSHLRLILLLLESMDKLVEERDELLEKLKKHIDDSKVHYHTKNVTNRPKQNTNASV